MAKDMYEQKVDNFLKQSGTKVNISYVGNKPHFVGETDSRDVYKVTLNKDGKSASYTYGQSIYDTQKGIKPSKADVLYGIKADNFDGDYDDFLGEFGYEDSKESKKIYNAVIRNSDKYNKIFNESEQEKLDEIYEDY